jgi:hypothetical protein
MPRMKGTIAVIEPVLHFGDTMTIAFTSDDPIPWGHMVVRQGGLVVCEQYQRLDHYPTGNFGLGPTPVWPSGAAEGTVSLVPFNTHRGIFGKPYATAAFTVLA